MRLLTSPRAQNWIGESQTEAGSDELNMGGAGSGPANGANFAGNSASVLTFPGEKLSSRGKLQQNLSKSAIHLRNFIEL